MLNPVRSVLEVAGCTAAGLAVAAMSGATSICGCPANCSPIVCVMINTCVHQTRNIGYNCAFEGCPGYEWTTPGNRLVERLRYTIKVCLTYPGMYDEHGNCVPNPNQMTPHPGSEREIEVLEATVHRGCPAPVPPAP